MNPRHIPPPSWGDAIEMRWFLSSLPEVRTGAFWPQSPPGVHAIAAVLAVCRSPSGSAPGQGLTRAGRRLTIARAGGRGWGPVVGPGAPSVVVRGQHRGDLAPPPPRGWRWCVPKSCRARRWRNWRRGGRWPCGLLPRCRPCRRHLGRPNRQRHGDQARWC